MVLYRSRISYIVMREGDCHILVVDPNPYSPYIKDTLEYLKIPPTQSAAAAANHFVLIKSL